MQLRSRVIGLLAGSALAGGVVLPLFAQEKSKPIPTVDMDALEKMKGPKPPGGATHLGRVEQPTAGELKLPIQNVDVYQFPVRTKKGLVVSVNWTYVPGQGTYLWASAPIQCGEGTVITDGAYAMRIRDDGSGGYLLGTNRCPTGRVYGCQFDKKDVETACGACAWNGNEVACTAQ